VETSWRDLPGVALTAGRLLLRHWPAMFALALLGVALRNGALWAAIRISDWNSFVAQLVLLLAPLGYLLPVIAMLHLCRPALGNVEELSRLREGEGRRTRRLLDVSVSVLAPFLAVYVSYQLFQTDRQVFLNNAAFAEFNHFNDGTSPDFGARLGIYSTATLVAIIAVSWVARWAIGHFEKRFTFLWLAIVGALVEVYWTSQVARNVDNTRYRVQDWINDRRATVWVDDHWDDVLGHLGWFGHPIANATSWVFGLIGSLDAVVVVPIGWLAVAAVVLGHDLKEEPTEAAAETTEPRRRRLRSLLVSLVDDLRKRWSAFFGGLRLIASGGLVPMLAFGLLFLLVIRIPHLVSLGIREIVGPIDTNTWLAFSPHESALGLAVAMVLTACALAAAIDWLLGARVRAFTPSEATPGSGTPASGRTAVQP